MNVVCLAGHLTHGPKLAAGRRPGWRSALMEVARQAVEDETEPGVVPVTVMLPPRLATRALGDLSPGAAVVVTGMLDVDVDRSGKVPLAYHSVIADKIERVADDFIAKHYGR